MLAFGTTATTTWLGGSTVDEFGDEVDGDTVLAEGVLMSIVEAGKTVQDPATGTPRVIRTHSGRAPHGSPIADVRRIRDDRTGAVYIVDSHTAPANPVWPQDLHIDLREVTTPT